MSRNPNAPLRLLLTLVVLLFSLLPPSSAPVSASASATLSSFGIARGSEPTADLKPLARDTEAPPNGGLEAPILAQSPLPAPTWSPTLGPETPGVGVLEGVEVVGADEALGGAGQGQALVPAAHVVESRLISSLSRQHPLGPAVTIGPPVGAGSGSLRLPTGSLVRINLQEFARSPLAGRTLGVRSLGSSGWQDLPVSIDPSSGTLAFPIDSLPITFALVDAGLAVSPPADWDPKDSAAVKLGTSGWGVAYVDAANPANLLYRRSLVPNGYPEYWTDILTVDSAADSPALVRVDNTLALFYRKAAGASRQVLLRTSSDEGKSWSTATQLTTESADVYQIEARISGGLVYVFYSLSGSTSELLYRSSSDLVTWSARTLVGRAIGPLGNRTTPSFSIVRLASGSWTLVWLDVSLVPEIPGVSSNTSYPVIWASSSSDLATGWSAPGELTLPYSQRWPTGLSLEQDSAGALYLAWSHTVYPWDEYAYHFTSSDGGVTWAGSQSYGLYQNQYGAYCTESPYTTTVCPPGYPILVREYHETPFGYEPVGRQDGRDGSGSGDSQLASDGAGRLRAFWDQGVIGIASGNIPVGAYPTQLYRRDLPGGEITPIPPALDQLALCGDCIAGAVRTGDPVNAITGIFTEPETDLAIPGRGLGLVIRRTYNSARLLDGPFGYGWTSEYDTRVLGTAQGDVLVVDGTGRSDHYQLGANGAYSPPPGRYGQLTHEVDATWTLVEKNGITRHFAADGKLLSIADRNSNSLTLAYDGNGKLSSIADPGGRSLTLSYSGSRISQIAGPQGLLVQYGYSGAGDLTTFTDARGKSWSYSYDSAHLMLTKTDPLTNVVFTNRYGAQGRVLGQKNAKNQETVFNYSGSGGQSWVWDPRGNQTTYLYDTRYRVTTITDSDNGKVYQTWDAADNLTRVQDSHVSPALVTEMTYDGSGNVLTRRGQLGTLVWATWTYTYNSANDLLTQTDPLNHTTTYTRDAQGNVTQITNAKSEVTALTPDQHGQVTAVTDARLKTTGFGYDQYGNQETITDPEQHTWTSVYDLLGRKLSVEDPLRNTTSFTYDAGGSVLTLTDGRTKVTSYGYDDAGRRRSASDPNGRTTEYGYDEVGRLSTVTDAAQGVTSYAYDPNGNLLSVTDGNSHARSFVYDKYDRLTGETDAAGNVTAHEYDPVGRQTKQTLATGEVILYAYDQLSRLVEVTYPTGFVQESYDLAGRRTQLTDETGVTSYQYDELDRPIAITHPGGRVVSYQYDAGGNRTRVGYPDGKWADYSYTDAGRLASVSDWLSRVTGYSYDDAGRATGATLPNGVSETRAYNAASQLESTVSQYGGVTLTSFQYALDDAGVRSAVTSLGGVESYSYDPLYRLTGVAYPNGDTTAYTYDPTGNRLTKTENGGTPLSYSYDQADRLTAVGTDTYANDPQGRRLERTTGGGTTRYCWDGLDRLVAATAGERCPVSYRVDAGGPSYQGADGRQWIADRFYSGTSGTASTSAAIDLTVDDPLYQKQRDGATLTYSFPVPNGDYTVTLKFAEITLNSGNQRPVNVTVEGTQVLSSFDAYAAAGGKNKAVDRAFVVSVSDGVLDVVIAKAGTNNARIAALEVVPSPAPATVVSYRYTGGGLRASRTDAAGTATYTWDVGTSLPVVLQDGTETYVYGQGLVSQTDSSSNTVYPLTDGLGSTRALTDAAGAVVATYDYDVFGAVRSQTGTASTEYRFTGQQDESALGYTYLRARYYDQSTGRFVSKDPLRGWLDVPWTQSRYLYVGGDPINGTDPSGLCDNEMAPGCKGWTGSTTSGAGAGALEAPASGGVSAVVAVAAPGPAQPQEPVFRSFEALKRGLGNVRPSDVWHHIVEQTSGNVARFGPESIQCADNVIRVTGEVNGQIAAYYSRIRPFSEGLVVRKWLASQSYEAQREFGLQVLRDFGVLQGLVQP